MTDAYVEPTATGRAQDIKHSIQHKEFLRFHMPYLKYSVTTSTNHRDSLKDLDIDPLLEFQPKSP